MPAPPIERNSSMTAIDNQDTKPTQTNPSDQPQQSHGQRPVLRPRSRLNPMRPNTTPHLEPKPTPATHLAKARLALLRQLPETHRIHTRCTPKGRLHLATLTRPNPLRLPFTEDELEGIRWRRRYAFDPDNVRCQMQDTTLVNMWNGEWTGKEQWKDYDRARPAMELKRDVSGLSGRLFLKDEIVRERRRQICGEEMELEEGEIIEDDEDLEVEGKTYMAERTSLRRTRTLMDMNERLRVENEKLRSQVSEMADKDDDEDENVEETEGTTTFSIRAYLEKKKREQAEREVREDSTPQSRPASPPSSESDHSEYESDSDGDGNGAFGVQVDRYDEDGNEHDLLATATQDEVTAWLDNVNTKSAQA